MSLLVSVGGAEGVIRLLGRTDADGSFVFRRTVLPPVRMPAPRPNARSQNGLYRYNSQSVRVEVEYAPVPVEGTIRIALFGDSFIHGDEVPFEQTVGYFLEQQLRGAGDTVERGVAGTDGRAGGGHRSGGAAGRWWMELTASDSKRIRSRA